MKKIISLFERDYEGSRLVYNTVVAGAEWVLQGEGVATEKFDGTATLIENGKLFKRFDRKLNKAARRRKKEGHTGPWKLDYDFKEMPDNWVPCTEGPDMKSGHWPGWLPVGKGPEDKHLRLAWERLELALPEGTYEFVGPKVQGNPYKLSDHKFLLHGETVLQNVPRDFGGLMKFFESFAMEGVMEGVVWHHEDGRMVKIKRKDFGLPWPVQ